MRGGVSLKFSMRGDAHKLYLRLKEMPIEDIKESRYLKEPASIKEFYQLLDSETLKLIYYQIVKEKSGIGIIPIFATAIPWLLFLFANPLENFLFHDGSSNWMIFSIIYLILLTISLILHFKEKAWAGVHTEIIQDILAKRD
ncbi:hypothetical protein D1B32_19605 [Oceanobacillus profundus]|uniref:Uncharacterized protein n=2 Tax=Bacillaceae TaxID=186817 RepID=A0A417YBH8_9BACI|nr:hypothetical protein [Oceanobacillus sp.]PAE27349.1 hypothetical protein CHI07_19935 [Paenibacillus sp. 7884-2]RHW29866.1 hypothetical protein D1B32_19605 [Oceanobacillus profundus]